MTVLRWTLAIAILLATLVIASVTAGPDDWSEAEAWAEGHGAAARPNDGCPVLFGASHAEDAGASYTLAATLAAAIGREASDRLHNLSRAAPAPLTDADREYLVACAPAVAALQRAAHCREHRSATSVQSSPLLLELTPAVDAMLVQATAPGVEPGQALPLLLDVVAVGLDVMAGNSVMDVMFGSMFVEGAVDAIDDRLLAGSAPAVLRDIAAAVHKAEASMAEVPSVVESTVVHLVQFLRQHPTLAPSDLGMATPLQAWRHGFSVRRSGMARVARLVMQVRTFESGCRGDEGWPDRQSRLEALCAAERADNSDLAWPLVTGLADGERHYRLVLTKLRLLRLALAFHQQLPLPRLRDPLGERELRSELTPEGALFHSLEVAVQRAAAR